MAEPISPFTSEPDSEAKSERLGRPRVEFESESEIVSLDTLEI